MKPPKKDSYGSESKPTEKSAPKDTEVETSEAEPEANPSDTEYTEGEESDVKVPEAFQKEAESIFQQCNNQPCLQYLRSLCDAKSKELMEAERGESPEEFSTSGMPEM